MNDLEARLAQVAGAPLQRLRALGGGCVGQVYLVELRGGGRLVAKVDDSAQPALDLEAYMLRYLAEHSALPVPAVVSAAADLLVMEWVPGGGAVGAPAEEHAAALLADLHGRTRPTCGLERDTLIGSLHQPNPEAASWLEFFAEHRLCYMAREAQRAGRLDAATAARVERLASRLERWLAEPAAASLLHGDVWSGNVLAAGGQVRAFLDPAIYYGHAEVELAFIALFHTFGERFFAAYRERRGIAPGFFRDRMALYNLYPLLVHTRLFGGGYAARVQQTLQRFGC